MTMPCPIQDGGGRSLLRQQHFLYSANGAWIGQKRSGIVQRLPFEE